MKSIPRKGLVTWVNHYSIQQCLDAAIPLDKFDCVGIDGFFLRLISGTRLEHSSADYSFPTWLDQKKINIGLVGGNSAKAQNHKIDFEAKFPHATILWSIPGDSGCLNNVEKELKGQGVVPDLVLVGMGAPLQEKIAIEIMALISREYLDSETLVSTCGGWLDQLGFANYYPKWSTPLRLNWLVRLCREPSRLWKRYLISPLLAAIKRNSIRKYLAQVREFLG
jgi:exopolysaccharide biosynthesis WecB/TagA/CpsF family protein